MNVDFLTREDYQLLDEKLSKILALVASTDSVEQKPVIKSAEVKRILNCSDATLKNYRDTGKLPYSKIGGTYYYKSHEVENMLKANGKA